MNELGIFYDKDWIDIDRIKLVEVYSDRKQLVDGDRRVMFRTMTGYEVFIDDKYILDYVIMYPQSRQVFKTEMSYNMYIEVVKLIAKESEYSIKEVMIRLKYKDE